MGRYLDPRDTDYVRDNMIFNYCLGDEQELLIESYVHNNQIDLCFDPHHFYFFMTGTHKKFVCPYTPDTFYEGVTGIYLIYDKVIQRLQANGYSGKPFLTKQDNSKQLAIIFSPGEHPIIPPEEMAQQLYEAYQSALTSDKPNASTSFVGPYSGYEQIHRAFLDARELNDLIFFGVRDIVITKEFRDKTARPCDITAILANVRRLTSTLCNGTAKEALRQADHLINEMVAPSYSQLNFAAVWAAVEDVLGMFETVYPQVRIERRALDSFHTLDQYRTWMHETLHGLFEQLDHTRRHSPTILMALSFINRNFTTDLSLTQLSEYVYANPSSLSSEFNAEVGMSLSEYVTSLRIQKAHQLLRESSASIPEIAQQAGFSSAKYFREIFKRQTGVSPQQYRNEHTEKHPT